MFQKAFRVIIAGGRDFNNFEMLEANCDYYLQNKKNFVVVCGMAKGADKLGYDYAIKMNQSVSSYPADWKNFGAKAGPLRNKLMAENADCLIAFWDGESKGTENMISIAKTLGLKVRVIKYKMIDGKAQNI